uniref:Small-subunit processome Utp12 domain-containing protein n=1 Tax=Plectus sambesii TaxID=2011161 RepID=A0A914XMR0_9BILA
MGITKQHLRYEPSGVCNVVGSTNGAIVAVDSAVCAIAACENVNFYNLRTNEKVNQLSGTKPVTALKFSDNRRLLAVGYSDGTVRVYDRSANDPNACLVFAGHKTGVNCLAFSKDGLTLASGGKDSTIILWDIVNESGLFRLNGHKGSITHLQFAQNGKFLISSSKDTFIKFWNMSTQSCFFTLTDHRTEVYTFALLKNDSQLITGSAELELRLFQLVWLQNGGKDDEGTTEVTEKVKRLRTDSDVGSDDDDEPADQANTIVRCTKFGSLLRQSKGRALQLVVSPDESLLLCLGSGPLVDIFRVYSEDEAQKRIGKKVRKAKKRAESEGHILPENLEGDVRKDISTLIGRIGDYRADAKVKWIDFARETQITTGGLEYRFFALHTNNTAHCVKVLSLKSGEVTAESIADLDQLGHRSDARSLAFSNDDFALMSTSAEGVIIWNRHSMSRVETLSDESCKDAVCGLFVTGDRHVVVGTKSGQLMVFDLAANELIETIKGHEGVVWSIVPTPDMKGFVSCSADKTVKFWLYELVSDGEKKRLTLRERRNLELSDEALCVGVSSNARFLAVGLLDNTTRIFFMDTLKFFLSLYGHSLPVLCLDMSDDELLIVTGSADKNLKIWGLDFGDCHRSLFGHDDNVTCVKFTPKSHLFWSAGKDGKIKQWDADKFEKIQTLDGHSNEVWALAMTSNGKFLASASHDKSIRLWEKTEEILVVQEEQEMERETEYEMTLADNDDVVAGEQPNKEADMATKKSVESIKSTESIIDAIEIYRNEKLEQITDPKHTPHPMILALQSRNIDRFILDSLHKVRSSDLEKSLMMVPFGFVLDILHALTECVRQEYKIELACRVIMFLTRIHHNQIVNSAEALATIDRLRRIVPKGVNTIRDVCGFNLAALHFLQLDIEEKQSVKLFAEATEKKQKKKKKAKDRAIVMSVV